MNEFIIEMCRRLLTNGKTGIKCIWYQCQWDSKDGTSEEFSKIYYDYGTPNEIHLYRI
jgi:hypothetical protein